MSYRKDMLIMAHQQFKTLAGKETDPRWATALLIAEKGNLNGAAKLVTTLLDEVDVKPLSQHPTFDEMRSSLNDSILELVIGTLVNLAGITHNTSHQITEMQCKAVDSGYLDCAYNAANYLQENARGPLDFERAERYFKIAISVAKDSSSKAAAIVNYCALVRDGLVNGKPDHLAAISLYEQAADLGLVIGMFNAANVSIWLADEGHTSLYEKASHWLCKVIAHVDGNLPLLEMDTPETVKELFNQALLMLANIHIQNKITNSNSEYGIKLLSRYLPGNSNDQEIKDWLNDDALKQRIMALSAPEIRSPGHHWRYILSALDWKVGDITSIDGQPFEIIPITLKNDKVIPLIVLGAMFKPGIYTDNFINLTNTLISYNLSEYLLVTESALFRENEGKIYTPILYFNDNTYTLLSLNCRTPVDDLITLRGKQVSFEKSPSFSNTCVISIAINMLNEGFNISDGLNIESAYIPFGSWNMPTTSHEVYFKELK